MVTDYFSVSAFCALGTCAVFSALFCAISTFLSSWQKTAGAEREVNDGVNPVCWLSALRRRSCLCGRRSVIRHKAPDMYASVNSGSGYRAGRTWASLLPSVPTLPAQLSCSMKSARWTRANIRLLFHSENLSTISRIHVQISLRESDKLLD